MYLVVFSSVQQCRPRRTIYWTTNCDQNLDLLQHPMLLPHLPSHWRRRSWFLQRRWVLLAPVCFLVRDWLMPSVFPRSTLHFKVFESKEQSRSCTGCNGDKVFCNKLELRRQNVIY